MGAKKLIGDESNGSPVIRGYQRPRKIATARKGREAEELKDDNDDDFCGFLSFIPTNPSST